MATRHKRIVAALDTGGSADWNDDHIADFSDEVTLYEDFITPAITTKWGVWVNAAGVAPVIAFVDHHSFVFLNSGAAQLDWSLMKYAFNGAPGNITYIDDAPIFTAAVWLEKYDAVNIIGEWGLMNNAEDPTLANKDGAYFRIDGNALLAVTGDGAAETTTDITPATGIPEYGHYRIELTGTNCLFYVDDMDTVAANHTANLPDSDLTIFFYADSGGVADTEMYVDGVGLSRFRYKG